MEQYLNLTILTKCCSNSDKYESRFNILRRTRVQMNIFSWQDFLYHWRFLNRWECYRLLYILYYSFFIMSLSVTITVVKQRRDWTVHKRVTVTNSRCCQLECAVSVMENWSELLIGEINYNSGWIRYIIWVRYESTSFGG